MKKANIKSKANDAPAPTFLPGYSLGDTAIERGGVIRCCLSTVALEYEGKTVNIGDKSKCQHCGEVFTLVLVPDGMMTAYQKPKFPVWKPDWQLRPANAAGEATDEPARRQRAHRTGEVSRRRE